MKLEVMKFVDEKITIDPQFLAIKVFTAAVPADRKEETPAERLLATPYEPLDEEEKKRRRMLGYKKDNDAVKDNGRMNTAAGYMADRKDVAVVVEYTGAALAGPKIPATREASVKNNYFGFDSEVFAPKNDHDHGHGAKKEENHYAMPHDIGHKHEANAGHRKHSEAGHFHADGSYHVRHEDSSQNPGHGAKTHAYDHACGGCNPGYTGNASRGSSITIPREILFIPRAA